ncbi:MAG: AAA family ATPase, partial [Phycicoccus sp.]
VLGDLAQGTTPWAIDSWDDAMTHLGHPAHERVVLDRGFRVPGLVIDFAARLLPEIAPGLNAPRAVRDNPGELTVTRADAGELTRAVVQVVRSEAAEPGSVGVICRDDAVADLGEALASAGVAHGRLGIDHGDDEDHQVELVPASIAKGLEFDRVIVVEPAAVVAAEPDRRTGLRRLYVVLTRAVTALTVVHVAPLPGALVEGGPG